MPVKKAKVPKKRGRPTKKVAYADKKVYCGVNKPKPNQRPGNMLECASQARRFGLYKIDEATLLQNKAKTTKINERKKLFKELGKIKGQMKKIEEDLPYIKTRDEKTNQIKKYNELVKVANELGVKINALQTPL